MDPETFRRICMAFDGLIVGFGLSRVLVELNLASTLTTYSILSIVVLINGYLLFRFFRDRPDPRQIPSWYLPLVFCHSSRWLEKPTWLWLL